MSVILEPCSGIQALPLGVVCVSFFFRHSRGIPGNPGPPFPPIRQAGNPQRTPAWIPTFGENDGREGRRACRAFPPLRHSRGIPGNPGPPFPPIRQAGNPQRTPAWIPTFGENDGRGGRRACRAFPPLRHSRGIPGNPGPPFPPIRQAGSPQRTPAWIPTFGENDGREGRRACRAFPPLRHSRGIPGNPGPPFPPIRQAGSPQRTPAWIPTFGENDGREGRRACRAFPPLRHSRGIPGNPGPPFPPIRQAGSQSPTHAPTHALLIRENEYVQQRKAFCLMRLICIEPVQTLAVPLLCLVRLRWEYCGQPCNHPTKNTTYFCGIYQTPCWTCVVNPSP